MGRSCRTPPPEPRSDGCENSGGKERDTSTPSSTPEYYKTPSRLQMDAGQGADHEQAGVRRLDSGATRKRSPGTTGEMDGSRPVRNGKSVRPRNRRPHERRPFALPSLSPEIPQPTLRQLQTLGGVGAVMRRIAAGGLGIEGQMGGWMQGSFSG